MYVSTDKVQNSIGIYVNKQKEIYELRNRILNMAVFVRYSNVPGEKNLEEHTGRQTEDTIVILEFQYFFLITKT